MYLSPIEMQIENLHRLAIQSTEDGIIKAIWNMGFKVDAEQLTCALTQDKKRYETVYDKGWNDCKEFYEAKLKKLSEIIAERSGEE